MGTEENPLIYTHDDGRAQMQKPTQRVRGYKCRGVQYGPALNNKTFICKICYESNEAERKIKKAQEDASTRVHKAPDADRKLNLSPSEQLLLDVSTAPALDRLSSGSDATVRPGPPPGPPQAPIYSYWLVPVGPTDANYAHPANDPATGQTKAKVLQAYKSGHATHFKGPGQPDELIRNKSESFWKTRRRL